MDDFTDMMKGDMPRRLIRQGACVRSDNNDYRYWLARLIDGRPCHLAEGPGKGIVFVMLNPSTAREGVRDPTDRRVQGFAAKFNANWYGIINLFGTSSPDPKSIFDYGYDEAVGSMNDLIIAAVFRECLNREWPVVCAWGKPSLRSAHMKLVRQRAASVMSMYNARKVMCSAAEGERPQPLYALAHTADRWPRHPLYLGQVEAVLTPHSGQPYFDAY